MFTTEADLFQRAQYPTTASIDYGNKMEITLQTETFQLYCRTDIWKQDTNNSMCHAFRLTPELTFSKMAADKEDLTLGRLYKEDLTLAVKDLGEYWQSWGVPIWEKLFSEASEIGPEILIYIAFHFDTVGWVSLWQDVNIGCSFLSDR